jgi:prepilin-type N-terminal cleavage/methylation domain-containing protein
VRRLLPISPSKKRAFTLIEILVASVILVIIVGSMTIIFFQANRSWTDTEARLQVYQNSREVLNSISRDLACAYQSSSTLAKMDYNSSAANPKLLFTAAVNTNYGTNEYDLSIVGYMMSSSSTNTVDKYKEDYDGTQSSPWSDSSGNWNPLAENITALDFEFYDHEAATPAWITDWDSSTKDYLPQAVKISLTAEDKQQRFSKTFETTVYIPAY